MNTYLRKVSDRLSNGYQFFCNAHHPLCKTKGGMVYMHRHVASVKEGRWLSSQEIVHHLDGNKANNDPINLEVTTRNRHIVMHKDVNSLHLEIVCPVCAETTRNKMFCSTPCRYAASRKFNANSEELLKLVHENGYEKTGRMLGVSGNAIKKRIYGKLK